MTLAQGMSVLGILGFIISVVSIGMTLWSRAKEQGRLAQAIDAATTSDREVSKMIQGQSVALESFAKAMGEQAAGMREVAQSFRDFTASQQSTNKEVWTAIQVQSARLNRVVEEQQAVIIHCPACQKTDSAAQGQIAES